MLQRQAHERVVIQQAVSSNKRRVMLFSALPNKSPLPQIIARRTFYMSQLLRNCLGERVRVRGLVGQGRYFPEISAGVSSRTSMFRNKAFVS
jgi:hypothetical protein